MNRAMRARFLSSQATTLLPSRAPAALFHSTPVKERRRNSQWKFNSYATRFRRKDAKRALLRDANEYLEHLLQGFNNSWMDNSQSSSSNYASWFEKQYFGKGRKKNQFHSQESQWTSYTNKRKGSSKFSWSDTDDEEFDSIFGSSFGRERVFHCSFGNEDFQRGSSRYRNRRVSWDWKDETDDENKTTESEMASDRLALGLTASGPLKLEEVKRAYRACALRWHPDRHHGSSKVAVEEKFKHCSAAYKSLCDKLSTG